MIGLKIIGAVNACFYVYYLMIIARCLLSFIPINYDNPIIRGLIESVDIYLNLFRKFIPPVGMFDLSPIVAFFALAIIRYAVIYALAFIFSMVGLL